MTDEKRERNRRGDGRKNTLPSLTLSLGPLVRAGDNTFSTTVRVSVTGWWEGGLPREAVLYLDDNEENGVEIHERTALFPLTGLEPESHHVVAARVHEHWVEGLLVVPELPKPKRPEEEALERERANLERAKVKKELTDLVEATSTKKLPAKLIVDPYRVGNEVSLLIRVVDEEEAGVPAAKLTIFDSAEGIKTQRCDEDGESEYRFELEPDEEREISVCISGYGDRSFRRTFRGRN